MALKMGWFLTWMTVRMYVKCRKRVEGNKERSAIDVLQKALLKFLIPLFCSQKSSSLNCGFCLHSLKELLIVLFFLKRKVNKLSWILNLGHSWALYYNFNRILHLEKRNTGEIITTWNSKHFDKKTRVTMTRIWLVWPGWYPCGSSGRPKEASDIINLKF